MEEKEKRIFREKTLERMSSPDRLTEYLRVTNPGIWIVLIAVILLLAGLIAWSAMGTLETRAEGKVIVKGHRAQVVLTSPGKLESGMSVHVSSMKTVIASVSVDEYGRTMGTAEISLPDGIYDGKVVVESTRPIEFLLQSQE